MKKNYDSIDVMKFIASLFVIGVHIHPFTSFNENVDYIFQTIAMYGVPFFFIVSSFFLFRKLKKCKIETEKRTILKQYIKRLLVLYLFWFIVEIPITFYLRIYIKEGSIFERVVHFLHSILFGSSFRGSWYLMATIIGTLLIYYISRKTNKKCLYIVCILAYILSMFASAYYHTIVNTPFINIINQYEKVFLLPHNSFCVSLIYIAIGKYIAENEEKYTNISKNKYFILWGLLLIAMIAEMLILRSKVEIRSLASFITLLPFSFVNFVLVLNIKTKNKYAKELRSLSIVNYFLHFIIIIILQIIEKILRIEINSLLAYFIVVISCLISYNIIKKLQKYKIFRFLKYSY